MSTRFSKSRLIYFIIFLISYLGLTIGLVGFRQDHLIFLVVIGIAYFSTERTHKFLLSFSFFLLFWIIYDALRALPNYDVNPIQVLEPYLLEKKWFGINHEGSILSPNEYLSNYQNSFLDFISGVYYLMWVPLPLAYGVYLFFKDKSLLLKFSACFLLVNLLGFLVYYLYPAAPPWYYEMNGTKIDFSLLGNAAGLIKFDEIIGLPIFEKMYTKNSNVYAAMPSLHAAYPMILFYFSTKRKNKYISAFFFSVILGIWFAAVYSYHHYIIDLLAGAICAIVTILIYEFIIKQQFANILIEKFVKALK